MTFHALIFSKVDYVDYALSAIAGLLSETDKSRLGAFFRKAKRRMVSAIVIFFISQLIDRADHELFKQIHLSHHCLNSLLPSSRLLYSR